eukprot:280376-Ditylum_brightwellii.AAC.1
MVKLECLRGWGVGSMIENFSLPEALMLTSDMQLLAPNGSIDASGDKKSPAQHPYVLSTSTPASSTLLPNSMLNDINNHGSLPGSCAMTSDLLDA